MMSEEFTKLYTKGRVTVECRWRGKVYKDVAQKRLDELRWRLHFVWKNVT